MNRLELLLTLSQYCTVIDDDLQLRERVAEKMREAVGPILEKLEKVLAD